MAMNQIPGDRLFIGSMFTLRGKTMQESGITHVLSVLRLPLDHSLFEGYEHMVVEVDDVEEENLIEYFASTYTWINKALEGGSVFIHCAMGKSRSATVLAAFLMKHRRISRDEALKLIRDVRPIVEPNPDFMRQLALYQQMDYTDDIDEHPIYQQWLFQRELELSRAAGKAPDRVHFRDAEKEVAEITRMDEGHRSGTVELRCKKCRRALANSQFLAPHIPKPALPPHPQTPSPQQACSHHFVEPLRWMQPELEKGNLEGKLECPKCTSKVGSYAWQGMKCSCGEWVVPGISLARSRVDEVKMHERL